MKIFTHTLGCKVNQYESQGIAEQFEAHGAEVVFDVHSADIILINSCTVTAESDRKTRQTVRHMKAQNPHAVLILIGCMVQAFPDDAVALTEADIVIGNRSYEGVYETYCRYLETKERQISIPAHEPGDRFTCPDVSRFDEHTRAYIKIEDGCNRFCSYCIIPYARGRVRSKPAEEIRAQAEQLAANGYKELVLVGINLTAYGQDNGLTLKEAAEAAASPSGIRRIRFGSMELDQIDDETLDWLAGCEKFCPQFHLSLQSGCDATLKRMNRHYDTAYYRDFVAKIRQKFSNPSFTTDLMVGFAGESEEDFEISRRFAEEIGFARIHVFAYSRRSGTKAYSLPGQVSNKEKSERSRHMIETAECLTEKFCVSQLGKTEEVLFEECENGIWYGYTKNYTRVGVICPDDLNGQIRKVNLTDAVKDHCMGKLV